MSYMQISKERNVGFIFNPLFMQIACCFSLESVLELDFGSRVVLERAICQRKDAQIKHVLYQVGDFFTRESFMDSLGV